MPSEQPQRIDLPGVVAAAAAMSAVGGAVAVSGHLDGHAVLTTQAVRYALAAGLLAAWAAATRTAIVRPTRRELCWLFLLAATGMTGFNVALVAASAHADPAVTGVFVGSAPLVIVAIAPPMTGSRPRPGVVAAAVVVVVGAAVVEGTGHADGTGLAISAAALGCEVCFTLCALPVLRRLGPLSLSVHACWIAAIQLLVLGVVREDVVGGLAALDAAALAAAAYLAVAVTAVAFVLWYTAVGRLGPATASLFNGIVPLSAAIVGWATLGVAPGPATFLGVAIVGGGVALGLRSSRGPEVTAPTGAPPPESRPVPAPSAGGGLSPRPAAPSR
ncbi:MAG: DMT family transporter [Actinomycetota bacterium]|nr:DMT family transporter [Actinomycetota bacterium]